MKTKLLCCLLLLIGFNQLFATGEPSTYFQIYVSPNNDAVRRDVCLIITAIYDNTEFEIIDDGADGDTDDSKTGVLKAGQSYILYIRDNGINDDARYASGGVLKWDGDYFIVKSNKLVFASQSTNSDWQHDWVPSVNKSSKGQKFMIYAPSVSSSKRDINVFPYEDNTVVQFHKISTAAKTNTGFTDVNNENPILIFSKTLNVGQDIIHFSTEGRDVMNSGETYVITSNKPITVQYGALFGNERDGGGYVPSDNGSSSGELLYFAVPYQVVGDQEIRIVSWDNANVVQLDRYSNGSWINMKTMTLDQLKPGEWVGKSNGNIAYPTVFRVTCSAGKKVSVFEGNWFETGAPGTSDMATMMSSSNGTSAGRTFLAYIPPPGNEANAINPFTGLAFGGQFSHLYLFSKTGATVTVKDAFRNGTDFSKTFTIAAGRYADCTISLTEWRNIYNGTGTTAAGPEKPYLIVESDSDISVMNSNFNDNWMAYSGSSLGHSFTQTTMVNDETLAPKDQAIVTSVINTTSEVTQPVVDVLVQDGLKILESKIINPDQSTAQGKVIEYADRTTASFLFLPTLEANSTYTIETTVIAVAGANNGNLLSPVVNSTVETTVTGNIAGEIQQSTTSNPITVNTTNTSNLMFSRLEGTIFDQNTTDSWNLSWVDINKDGFDDLFVTDVRFDFPNKIFMNNQIGGFNPGQVLPEKKNTKSSTWADVDNDGDIDLVALGNTRTTNRFYRNDNGVLALDNSKSFTQEVGYYHGGAFADYDNDNKVDLFLCNIFPTKYNELHKNGQNGVFTKDTSSLITLEANASMGPTWADYDQDGFMDLFVPNGQGKKNSLFHNKGNGTFTKESSVINNEGGQSVGSCWGDIDNDGDLDLFVANSNTSKNFMYKNNGDGTFTKVTNSIVTQGGVSHGCSFADVDNDGDLDLYVTNDKTRKFLYLNDGTGFFVENRTEVICYNYGNAFGHAWSDYDHDGDLDLAVATHSVQKNHIFKNNGNSNNWLEINLTATVSNGSAIGAKVKIYTSNGIQFREVNAQSGIGGQSSFTQHFGLKNTTVVDSIQVKWPSGIIQKVTNVNANQIITIVEEAQLKVNGLVFLDTNNDGIKQANEVNVPRAGLLIQPSNKKVIANDSGNFSFYTNENLVSLNVMNLSGLNVGAPIVFDLSEYRSNTILEIPATIACVTTDLKLTMGGTAIRKGNQNGLFKIMVTNQSQVTSPEYNVEFKIPSAITLTNLSVATNQQVSFVENNISYTRYIWTLTGLKSFEEKSITFNHGNIASVQIGNEFTFEGQVVSVATDCDSGNNLMQQKYLVYGAIDPNDILVSPKGYGSEGYVLANQTLTYTVRFENIGNFPAQKVTITDLLPDGLDISSFKFVASSHENVKISIDGQLLQFVYEDMFLPSNAADLEGSMGYVSFSLNPKAGIDPETILDNKASIQFDNYMPIITNNVRNTIQSKEKDAALFNTKVYPNPATDVVFISLMHQQGQFYTHKVVKQIEIMNLLGQTVLSKEYDTDEEIRIDLPIDFNGIYLMKITDSEGKEFIEKLGVKMHQ